MSELVHGATLEELSREGATSDRDIARIGGALCDALEHAHARGVVHRDVKPANVMVLAEPAAGAGFAKLTDFGIAHLATGDDLTATGDVVGTLAYMAPEQAEGRRVTGATDVYSLALTLYEAWTGSNPVRAASPAATARRVGRALPPLSSRRPDLPPDLCEVIDAALDADPEYRPDPAELRDVLRGADGELSDEGGLVEPETLERFGLTAVRARTQSPDPAAPRAAEAEEEQLGLVRPARRRGRSPGLAAGMLVFAGLEGLGPAARVLDGRGGRRGRRAGGGVPARRLGALRAVRVRLARHPRGRPAGHRAACLPRRWRPRRSCCPAPGCSGRCPPSRRCWAPWRWLLSSWGWPRWPPPPGGGPGLPQRGSSGSRPRRCSPATSCCSAPPTARWRASTGRAPWWTPPGTPSIR